MLWIIINVIKMCCIDRKVICKLYFNKDGRFIEIFCFPQTYPFLALLMALVLKTETLCSVISYTEYYFVIFFVRQNV